MNAKFIPQANPKAYYLSSKDKIITAISRVLDSGSYILGNEVKEFEKRFAEFTGLSYAIGVASGTDAIEICLRAMDIGPGDSVFTVSHTAVATLAAIERAGATPCLVDIDPLTYTMSASSLEEAIVSEIEKKEREPAAIVVVHLYGQSADMDGILDVTKKYQLKLVEDCAQAHGARFKDKYVGTFGDMAAFSFYPTKNLGAFGDGGVIVTDNYELARKVKMLREYGWSENRVSNIPGVNSRLDEIQAAILNVRLETIVSENERRRKIAYQYNSILKNVNNITIPVERDGNYHVYHQYVIQCPERDKLQAYLMDHNIGTAVHYPHPVHLQPAYRNRLPIVPSGLAETEKICSLILSLPIYPQLTNEEVEYIGEVLSSWKF